MDHHNGQAFKVIQFNLEFFLINVYAPHSTQGKKKVWEYIESFLEHSKPIKVILVGHFNVAMNTSKKMRNYTTYQSHGGL